MASYILGSDYQIAPGVPDASRIQFLGFTLPDPDQTPGVFERQRAQDDGVENAEDGGIGSDSERQHQDHHSNKTWFARKHPERVRVIAAQLIQKRDFHPTHGNSTAPRDKPIVSSTGINPGDRESN